MTNDELQAAVKALVEQCDKNDPYQGSVSSVLCVLMGAMKSDRTKDLMLHTAEFAEAELKRLAARFN